MRPPPYGIICQMKLAIILYAVLLFLPQPGWGLVTESIPFYYFDGASYTVAFMLPETYFVSVEEQGDEFDRVSFLDLSGYIRHGAASIVDYEPVSKYPTAGSATLKKSVSSVWLYSDADMTSVVGVVTASDSIFLYGVSKKDNIFYVRVGTPDDFMRGYISGEAVDVTYPPENDISAISPDPPENNDPEVPPADDGKAELSYAVQIILVVTLAVPAFLLVFLLSTSKKH